MKKKLLTVLLAVVMVFGVFGLTACGGSNADEDYNYYGIKYEIEDEVKIEAVTFQAVYKMFTTAGSFVLYVDSETGASTKANMQAVNALANEWGITIYHFNPDLTGGYAKDLSNAVNANIITKLEGIAAESQLKAVQDTLLACSNTTLDKWSDATLVGIKGAESAISNGKLSYKGSVAKAVAISEGADKAEAAIAAVALKKPSFGSYTEADRDEPTDSVAFQAEKINTMNLFGDARLHMYDDRDALKEEKTDVYVTVANYAMFAHLLDNNEGYFPVFFGGTWCPNTQAIAKETDKLAKDYGITKIYFFDPRLDDGVRLDDVSSETTWSLEQYTLDAKAAGEAYAAASKAWAAAQAAYVADAAYNALFTCKVEADAVVAATKAVTAAEKALTDLQKEHAKELQYEADKVADAKDADKAKAQAAYDKLVADQAKEIEKAEKAIEDAEKVETKAQAALVAAQAIVADFQADYGDDSNVTADTDADKEYLLNRLIDSRKAALTEAKKGTDKDAIAAAQAAVDFAEAVAPAVAADKAAKATYEAAAKAWDAADKAYDAAQETAGFTTTYSVVENKTNVTGNLNTRAANGDYSKNYKAYNYNYTYGSFLKDYLNTYKSEWNITGSRNNINITVGSETAVYTRMCVPNIMMFNGEEEGKAALVALAEAEYYYADVNVEGTAENIAWTNAVKAVFDANPYAEYLPIVAAPEAAAPEASAPAASAPAADAGGC